MEFSQSKLLSLEELYRRNLMNTLTGYKNGNLIGTQDENGNTNLAVFNSVFHIGAKPPHIGFVLRPTTVARHTYDNIRATGYYTINHIHTEMTAAAHQTSAKYAKEESEFEKCGFTPQFSTNFGFAPYVKESRIKIGLKFAEEIYIKTNDVWIIVGEVQEIIIDENFIRKDGFIDLQKAGTSVISGLDAYYEATEIARYAFARPNQELQKIG